LLTNGSNQHFFILPSLLMSKKIVLLLIILTMLIWAANFYFVKIALAYFSPMGVAAWRFLFAVIVLIISMMIQRKTMKLRFYFSKKEWWYLFLTAFLGTFLTMYFFNKGLLTASPINGSLIIATSPVFTAIFARFLVKKKLSILQWFSIFLSILGVTILLVKGDLNELFALQVSGGDGYIVLMSIVLSLAQIVVVKNLGHVDSILLTTVTCTMAFLLFIACSLPEILTTPLPSDGYFWGSIVFMGILGTGLGYIVFYLSIVELGATKTILFMNLIPFFVVLIAILFGEPILISQLIGGMIIILGLWIFNRENKKGVLSNA
jgi:drug/metabolite transporter (DMT)-like permease